MTKAKVAVQPPDDPTQFPVVVPDGAGRKPWQLTQSEAAAIKRVAQGGATDDQQRKAFDTIIRILCGNAFPSYRRGPNGRSDTDFNEGRRHVGLVMLWLAGLNTTTET